MFDLPTADGIVSVTFFPRLNGDQIDFFQSIIHGIRSRQELVESLQWFAQEEDVYAEIMTETPSSVLPPPRLPRSAMQIVS